MINNLTQKSMRRYDSFNQLFSWLLISPGESIGTTWTTLCFDVCKYLLTGGAFSRWSRKNSMSRWSFFTLTAMNVLLVLKKITSGKTVSSLNGPNVLTTVTMFLYNFLRWSGRLANNSSFEISLQACCWLAFLKVRPHFLHVHIFR